MADPVTDQFGNVVEPIATEPDIVTSALEWQKARDAEATTLMRNAASFNPDAGARAIEIADKMGLDYIDESAIPTISDQLRQQEVEFQASVSKLATKYPELHDWLFRPNNAKLVQDDLPQARLSYDALKMATDRAHVMDDRPELGLVRSFGAGEHAAMRRFGALALAVPAWISALGSGRQTGPDAPASQRWFDSLWDAQTANDQARTAFQQTFGQRVSEAAGGLVGDPFTYAGIGVAAKLASTGTKAAINGASMVAYGQEVASAYSDVARSNLSKGLSPYASPFQHVMVNLAGITTMAFEKIAGPVGELGFLNKVGGGGATATRVVLGGALSEGGEEAAQTLFESSATGEPVYAGDLAESGLIGAILGGGMGLPSGVSIAFAKAHNDIVKPAVDVAQSTLNAQNAATAMQSLAQSKLAQRAPQRLVNYAETLTGDKTYTVSKADWDAIWTKVNKSPEQAAVAFDGRLVNDTYEFSAGRYLALGSVQEPAIQAGLVEAFRAEGAPSLNQALEIMAELEQRAKDIKPEVLPSGAIDDSAEIEDAIYQQMVSTGASKSNAKGTAQLIARHYVQLAEEMNAGRTEGKLTPKELYDFKPISFGVETGAKQQLEQRAYHGTGNTQPYEKFDYEKVGAAGGEGNQAYGWGLYFTSLKKVAAHYRSKFGTRDLTLEQKVKVDDALENVFGQFPSEFGIDVELVMDEISDKSYLQAEMTAALSKKDAEAIADLAWDFIGSDTTKEQLTTWAKDNLKFPELETPGKLYTVEIPEDSEMLDWDKPLSEQSRSVKDALRKLPIGVWQEINDHLEARNENSLNDDPITTDWFTGKMLYKALRSSEEIGDGDNPQKDASNALRVVGIPGLTYMGEARKAGGDVKNYVIFDDSKIQITALEQRAASRVLGEYDPVSGNVRLASKHNYSTALHEAAHHFLTLLSFFEGDKNAPPYFKEQMDRFRKWIDDNAKHVADEYNARNVGSKVTADDIKNTPFTEAGRSSNFEAWAAQHEYFARGFEEWLREGKAPDRSIRGLFNMFARWIKGVYQNLDILGVKLDDNSRQMFGRLFASQAMIDAANAEANRDVISAELLTKMGLSPEEVATIQRRNREEMDEAFDKNVQRIARSIKNEDREKREALRGEAFSRPEEYLSGPEGQAAIANAVLEGDAEFPGAASMPGFGAGLDEASVRALVPPGMADRLVAAKKTAKTGGAKLEEVMALVGANNPIELVEGMLTAAPWQDVVKKQVDAAEIAAYGPAITKEKAVELALDAAYGPERQSSAKAMAKVVLNNIKKSGDLADAKPQIDIEAVEAAQYTIAERLGRQDLKPAKWRKLANQAAKDANRAITSGDADAFARAKATEAIALKRADIEEELADAYDKAEKRIKRFVNSNGKDLSVGPQDYRVLALNLLSRFGFGQPVAGEIKPDVKPSISPVVAEAMPGPVDNVLLMLELADSLDNIIAAQKKDNQAYAFAYGKSLDDLRKAMEDQAEKTAGKRIQVGSLREKVQKWVVGPSLRLASMLTVLDGGKPGVFTKLGDIIRDSDVRMEQIRKRYAEPLLPIIRNLSVFPAAIPGTKVRMSGGQKVMFAAHYGSETGRQRAIGHLRILLGKKIGRASCRERV